MTIVQPGRPVFESQGCYPVSSRSLRVLFLAPFAPHLQASHGGGRVIAELITHLARRHSIGLCYLRTEGEPAIEEELGSYCDVIEEVLIPELKDADANRWSYRLQVWKELLMGRPLWAIDRFSPAYEAQLKRLLQTWRPDVLQIEFHIMGQYLSALTEYPAPRILVEHEPGEESFRELMRSGFAPGRIIPYLDLLAWKRFERQVTRQVQAVVVFTERDRQSVRKRGHQANTVLIPPGTEIPEPSSQTTKEEPLSLLFVGSYQHLPNVDAADRLINIIFPQVQREFPKARLYIVGAHWPSRIVRSPNENVILTGYVPDLKPYHDRAALVMAPLRLGGGMRIKVLEALAAGKPVIATSRAIEGLDLEDGRQFVLADSDQEFSRASIELLHAPELRARLSREARSWACANLSWEKAVASYENLYRSLLNDGFAHERTV